MLSALLLYFLAMGSFAPQAINADCPICLERVPAHGCMIGACRHAYCTGCIRPWIAAHHNCPLCKGPAHSGDLTTSFDLESEDWPEGLPHWIARDMQENVHRDYHFDAEMCRQLEQALVDGVDQISIGRYELRVQDRLQVSHDRRRVRILIREEASSASSSAAAASPAPRWTATKVGHAGDRAQVFEIPHATAVELERAWQSGAPSYNDGTYTYNFLQGNSVNNAETWKKRTLQRNDQPARRPRWTATDATTGNVFNIPHATAVELERAWQSEAPSYNDGTYTYDFLRGISQNNARPERRRDLQRDGFRATR